MVTCGQIRPRVWGFVYINTNKISRSVFNDIQPRAHLNERYLTSVKEKTFAATKCHVIHFTIENKLSAEVIFPWDYRQIDSSGGMQLRANGNLPNSTVHCVMYSVKPVSPWFSEISLILRLSSYCLVVITWKVHSLSYEMASTRNLYLNTGVSSAATSAGMKTILWAVPRAT